MSDQPQTTEPDDEQLGNKFDFEMWEYHRLVSEIERLRKFIQEVADGHDAMISRLVRDTAKEVLDGR